MYSCCGNDVRLIYEMSGFICFPLARSCTLITFVQHARKYARRVDGGVCSSSRVVYVTQESGVIGYHTQKGTSAF